MRFLLVLLVVILLFVQNVAAKQNGEKSHEELHEAKKAAPKSEEEKSHLEKSEVEKSEKKTAVNPEPKEKNKEKDEESEEQEKTDNEELDADYYNYMISDDYYDYYGRPQECEGGAAIYPETKLNATFATFLEDQPASFLDQCLSICCDADDCNAITFTMMDSDEEGMCRLYLCMDGDLCQKKYDQRHQICFSDLE